MTDISDQALTDVLAATLIENSTLDVSNGERLWGAFPNSMTINDLADALALVVKQHNQGQTARIAELAAKYGHLLGRNEHLADRLRARIGYARDMKSERDVLKATVARVQKALESLCDSCDYTELRAALEGEQR